MSRLRRNSSQGLPDEYGPMTDLIFSLFAISILLLSIVGTDGNVTREKLANEIDRKNEAIIALNQSLDQTVREQGLSQTEADRLADEMRGLRVQLAEARQRYRDLVQLKSGRADDPAIEPPKEDETLAAEREQSLIEAAETLRKQLLDMNAKYQDLLKSHAERAGQVYRRLELPGAIAPPGGSRSFLVQGRIDTTVLDEIRTALLEQYEGLLAISTNRILLEIDIADDYRLRRGGRSEDPDYTKALNTAAALNDAFRYTPMPIACIVPVPYGKSRSGAVTIFTTKPSMNDRLRNFEAREGVPDGSASGRELARIADADTRIRLVAEHAYSSPCTSQDVLDAIVRWNEGALLDQK